MRRRQTATGPLLWLAAVLVSGCAGRRETEQARRPDGGSGPTGAVDAGGAAAGGGAGAAAAGGGAGAAAAGGGADAAKDIASSDSAPLPDGGPPLDSGPMETAGGAPGTLTLPIATYLDKLKGGWVGQMAAGRWM